MYNLLWMLADDLGIDGMTSIEDFFTGTVWGYVQWVLYILAAVLGVVLIVKGITTALGVMKAADEPQVRQEKINAFKYLAIGLGVAIVILTLAPVIINLILSNADVQAPGTQTPTTDDEESALLLLKFLF